MIYRLYRTLLFALYQATIALGIVLLPVAVAMHRIGLPLPVHRLIAPIARAYDAGRPAP